MKANYDVVVVGAGPAGITAAIYLKRAGLKFILLEKAAPGGQLNNSSSIENYPGFKDIPGPELAMKFFEQITELGIDYKYGDVISIEDKKEYKIVKTTEEEITTKAVILAIGRKPRTLKVENAAKFEAKGISFCALCDGFLYKEKEVAIIGGGNSSLEESLYLSGICKKVTLIYRGTELKGDKVLVQEVSKKPNIEIIYEAEIDKFNGGETLESIDLNIKGKIKNIKVSACFIFIGYEPASKFLEGLDILDKKGYIIIDEKKTTPIDFIYGAGDITKKEAYQIVTAISDGALAAVACIKDLNNKE